MIRRAAFIAVVFLAMTLFPLSGSPASFDCASAATDVEALICADSELSALDDDVADAHNILRAQSEDQPRVVRHQRGWLAKRNRCTDRDCIKSAYQLRLAELTPLLKIPISGDCTVEDLDDGRLSVEVCLAIRQARARRDQRDVDPCAGAYGANPMMFCLRARAEREVSLVNRVFQLAMRVVEDPIRLKEEQDYWRGARYGDCKVQSKNGEELASCELQAAQERREQLYKTLRGDCHDYRDHCIPRRK